MSREGARNVFKKADSSFDWMGKSKSWKREIGNYDLWKTNAKDNSYGRLVRNISNEMKFKV